MQRPWWRIVTPTKRTVEKMRQWPPRTPHIALFTAIHGLAEVILMHRGFPSWRVGIIVTKLSSSKSNTTPTSIARSRLYGCKTASRVGWSDSYCASPGHPQCCVWIRSSAALNNFVARTSLLDQAGRSKRAVNNRAVWDRRKVPHQESCTRARRPSALNL